MFSREGVNAGMLRFQESMAKCFDWGRLVHERPTREDVHAFGVVAEMLLPYLRKTCWPNEAAFSSGAFIRGPMQPPCSTSTSALLACCVWQLIGSAGERRLQAGSSSRGTRSRRWSRSFQCYGSCKPWFANAQLWLI